MAVPVSTTIQNQIANLYIAILGRNPDPAGFGFWCDTLANNNGTAAALDAITIGFSNSPEFIATYGGRPTEQAVGLMYTNVLDRTADAGGLAFWTAAANAYIAQGYTIAQAYALTGNDIITAASTNTGSVDQTLILAKEAAAVAAGTAAPTTTYTLTTGIDNVPVGSNSVINAADSAGAQTWTALDTITGSGNGNTFNVASGLAISNPAGSTVTGIQTMNVTEAGAAAAVTLDTTAFTGLTNLTVTNAGTGTDTITAAATTSVTDSHVLGGASVINGGLNVAATKAQSVDGNVVMGTITIGGTTAAAGTVTVTNTDTITASTGGANTTSAITVTGGNGVTITDTVNSIVTNTATAVTYTQKGANGAVVINNNTNVTTTGAAIALTGNSVAVNGSATATDAGATTITVNNTATATQVAVTPSTITQGVVGITGGTATTAVTVNQASTATAAATVAAVAGVVGVTAVAAAPGTAAKAAVTAVTPVAAVVGKVGVVAGAVTIADVNGASNTTANTLATVTLNSIGTGSSITSSALTTLNLGGVSTTGATLLITDNLTANTNANVLNLNTTAATGGVVITASKVGTLNITNSGTSALGAFTDTNLKTVTVAGSGVITLGANSATTETITGAVGVKQTIDNTVVTFNASGSTGTSTITTSTTGTKVITAGSGGSDELVLGANSTWTATTGGKFVGFEILGLGASITQDASVFGAGIKTLNIATTGQTSVISKMNTGAAINLAAAATTTTSLTVGYVDTTGATDSTTITFNGPTASTISTGAAQTVSTLVLNDANGIGINTLNIIDNNVAFNYAGDNITTFSNTAGVALSNLNFSGVGGFAMGGTAGATPGNFVNTVTSMTINNTGTNAAGLIVGMTANSMGNLTFTGSGKTTLNLVDTVAGTLNITNSGTGSVTVSDGGANTVAANINLTGKMTATLTDPNLTSLALSDGQAVTLTAANTGGITITGAGDHSRVQLTLGAAASTKTNTVTLGNGNNNIVDRTTAGTSTITVGTGSNLIDAGISTGENNSTGLWNITTGTRASTTVGNQIIVGTGGTNYATVAPYAITGLTTGDQVAFLRDGASLNTGSQAATSLTGAANVAGAISTLVTAATGLHKTAWGVYNGDTYVVQDATGTAGATATTVLKLVGLTSTTTGALSFTDGGFTIGSTNSAIAIDSGASKTFALATSQVFTSAYSAAYTITQTAGAAGSVTLTGATASGTIDLTNGTGTSTINVSASSGIFAITGGGGVDTIISGGGADTITGAAGNDIITLGGGIDTVILGTVTAAGTDVITDLVGGTDVIKTGAAFATAALGLTAKGAVAGATLADALATFAAGQANETVALNAYTFTNGGNTYLLVDNGTTGYAAGTDSVVQITGVTGTLAAAGIFNA